MTTKDFFLNKLTNPQDFDFEEAYRSFFIIVNDMKLSGDMPELEDIYPADFEDMPYGVQLADRYLMEVVPHLDIDPGDIYAEEFYEAAACLD